MSVDLGLAERIAQLTPVQLATIADRAFALSKEMVWMSVPADEITGEARPDEAFNAYARAVAVVDAAVGARLDVILVLAKALGELRRRGSSRDGIQAVQNAFRAVTVRERIPTEVFEKVWAPVEGLL